MIDWNFKQADSLAIEMLAELAILFGTTTMCETLDRALAVMHDVAKQLNEGCDAVYLFKDDMKNG